MFPSTEFTAFSYPVVVTDQLAAPADFLLHRIITAHLKDNKRNSCILLSMSSDLAWWKAVSASRFICHLPVDVTYTLFFFVEHNVNIDQHIKSGSFKFIDLTSHLHPPQPSHTGQNSSLYSLFELISKHINEIPGHHNPDNDLRTLVVFDDTSSIEWLGHSITNSTRFTRALSSLCRNVSAHHTSSP
jgi:hypothetical protein